MKENVITLLKEYALQRDMVKFTHFWRKCQSSKERELICDATPLPGRQAGCCQAGCCQAGCCQAVGGIGAWAAAGGFNAPA